MSKKITKEWRSLNDLQLSRRERRNKRKNKKQQKNEVPSYLKSEPIRKDANGNVIQKPTEEKPKKKRRYETYQNYLDSKKWKNKRSKILKRDNFKCVHCGGNATHVHHKKYSQWGKENLKNLESVCKKCHEIVHEIHEPEMPEFT